MRIETWKDIPGYEGKYQVSNDGRVKSMERLVDRGCKGFKLLKERYICLKQSGRGYNQVVLFRDSIKWYPCVHKLVALAFIPNPENKPQVNHINGIKTDNRVENLEWVTQSENQLHAVRTGLQPHLTGEARGKVAKLKFCDVVEIKALINMGVQNKLIAKQYNINPVTVSNIKTGAIWKNV